MLCFIVQCPLPRTHVSRVGPLYAIHHSALRPKTFTGFQKPSIAAGHNPIMPSRVVPNATGTGHRPIHLKNIYLHTLRFMRSCDGFIFRNSGVVDA